MKTAAQIWLDYGRTLDVGATEKALAELDAEVARQRAALKPFAELGAKLDGAPNLIGILTEEDWKRAARAFNGEQNQDTKP